MKTLQTLALLVIGATGLVGCGDGGVQSPDFTPELIGLSIAAPEATPDSGDPTQFVLPVGGSTPLEALGSFSVPPGEDEDSGTRTTDADFSGTPSGIASFDGGRITGTQIGVVTVSASRDGVDSANTLRFRIVAPVLESINIDPDGATISQFQTQAFTVQGTFSDDVARPLDVQWTVVSGPASISNATGATTTVTPDGGSAGQTVVLRATATSPDVNGTPTTFTDEVTVTINNDMILALTDVRPSNSTVGPAPATVDFTAVGTFSDGTTTRTADIPDGASGLVDWSSSNAAEVPIDAATGVVSGQVAGKSATITATLKASVVTPTGAQRSASTNLAVTDARCTTPLLASQGATTSVVASDLCIACSVTAPDASIDGDIDTFSTISLPLGLLTTANISLNIDAPTAPSAPFAPGSLAGFVVAKPAGLLSAELLSALTVGTRLAGQPVEAAGAGEDTVLNVTALGVISLTGQEAFLLSFPTTQAYDGLALTFNGGVLSLLPTVNVFQACGTAQDAATP